ncbi:MAG: aminotransferase class V-fold PLP-dependent enzyme, partial [Deltaproteobacteria bacterium]|nr:aminotransferase class V-fold PLP-dependent enzyme [Deltaproteobacteria bacterium]
MIHELDLDAFRAAYGAFLRADRVLLTGHSHQAWPDVAEAAHRQAFLDAARFVDDKWSEAVFPLIARVSRAVASRLGFADDEPLAFGQSTHDLVSRLLSCFPWDASTRVVTTTGEFHSLDRQLRRLGEAGLDVRWIDATDRASLAPRVVEAITPGTSLVALSVVMFEDAWILRELDAIAARAAEVGAAVLFDAYHAFNVVPLDFASLPGEVYVTAGGYKYAQIGEGCCFLRIPAQARDRRPRITGWFSDFDDLARARSAGARPPVGYGSGGARFAGSTFDPTSFYRAAAVLDHFARFGLDPQRLRTISLAQTRQILHRLDQAGSRGLGLEPVASRDDLRRGGFVAVRTAHADRLVRDLRARGVFVDARGDLLRLGPAPYLTPDEIDRGVVELCAAAR